MGISPAFFEGKSECRVRVFLESGFCTGPSPGPSPSPVRVSQYATLASVLEGDVLTDSSGFSSSKHDLSASVTAEI